MRVRRAVAAAAAAIGLTAVALTACTDGDDGTTEPGTGTGSSGTSERQTAETGSADELDEQAPSAEAGPSEPATDAPSAESVPDESDSAEAAPEDTTEPGGNDAEWMSPDSSDTQVGAAAGGDLSTIRVRTGVHEYYDRVVLDLEGEDTSPGWTASYVANPVEDGSGAPLDIEGEAFLHLSVSGFRMPVEGEPFHQGVTDFDGGGIDQISVSAPFEGMIQVVIGVDAARSYRVFTLGDPLRLVIDVEAAG